MKAAIFEHPVSQLTVKYFGHFKTKNFRNKGSLCRHGQQVFHLRKSHFPGNCN